MEWSHPCPLCCVRHQASPLGWALTMHRTYWAEGKTIPHGVPDSRIKKKFMFNRDFGHSYECMIITRRLCHTLWSRKWHDLPPQTLMWIEEELCPVGSLHYICIKHKHSHSTKCSQNWGACSSYISKKLHSSNSNTTSNLVQIPLPIWSDAPSSVNQQKDQFQDMS